MSENDVLVHTDGFYNIVNNVEKISKHQMLFISCLVRITFLDCTFPLNSPLKYYIR